MVADAAALAKWSMKLCQFRLERQRRLSNSRSGLLRVLCHVGASLLQRRRHTYDGRHILRSGAAALFLVSALYQSGHGDSVTGIQRPNPFWAVEFVGG